MLERVATFLILAAFTASVAALVPSSRAADSSFQAPRTDEERARAWSEKHVARWERRWAAGLEAYNSGKYAVAEQEFREGLVIAREFFSHTDKRFLETIDNLALATYRTGDNKKAISLYEESVLLRESALGKGHPSLAPALDNLGTAYMAEKEYDKAEDAFRRSLEIRDIAFGKESPELARSLLQMGDYYRAREQDAHSRKYFERALVIVEKRHGPQHLETAAVQLKLADGLRAEEEFVRAEELYDKALATRTLLLRIDHPETATAQIGLAKNHVAQWEHFPEAEALSKTAIETKRVKLGLAHADTKAAVAWLEELYREWEEMKEHRFRAFLRGVREKWMNFDFWGHYSTANGRHTQGPGFDWRPFIRFGGGGLRPFIGGFLGKSTQAFPVVELGVHYELYFSRLSPFAGILTAFSLEKVDLRHIPADAPSRLLLGGTLGVAFHAHQAVSVFASATFFVGSLSSTQFRAGIMTRLP